MAEVQEKDKGGKKRGKQKKMRIHVDFTPMVDMNMLLICFFMLATSMSKPQTMEISMPTNDKVSEADQTKVKASRAVTVLLDGKDKLYYYLGEPNLADPTSLKETNYTANGLRAMLINKNSEIVQKMNDLKKKKLNLKISEEEFNKQALDIKSEKTSPVVIIKATDKSNYKNLIDVLDEMQICSISKYAIVDITAGDKTLIKNLDSASKSSSPTVKN
jgi:biopolymer transport protein ExbD